MAAVFQLGTQGFIHQKESLCHYAPKLRIHTSYKPSARNREYMGAHKEIPHLQATMYYFVYHINTIALY